MDTVTTDTTTPDKAITVDVPADRVPEFYAWYARFLAPDAFRGRRRGRHGGHRHGPHGHHHCGPHGHREAHGHCRGDDRRDTPESTATTPTADAQPAQADA